ncbi:MAG TPA: hypothetical protein VNI35_05390 [Nitrospira sp.]|nr:hypothetical protein [Nitrospira sp.]
MRKCIKCGYLVVGMLAALIVSDMSGMDELSTVGTVFIACAGAVLGYLFASILLAVSPEQTDKGRFRTGRGGDISDSLAARVVEE